MSDLPEFVGMADVLKLMPFKTADHWILTQTKKKRFPAPIKVNRKLHLWRTADVQEWIRRTFNSDSHVTVKTEPSHVRPERAAKRKTVDS